ncbi:GreA/GreB family elongation factor [Patescibacteria group bacterium]|nr:GreA/GreB family elongation factor [Patescibacteria group bacterium]
MFYYFLKLDLINLEKKILEILEEIKKIGEKIGESCESGADTWHDNFDYEEGMRQMHMVSSHLKQLTNIRNKSKIITPTKSNDKVSIGKTVVCLINDEEFSYTISSYMLLEENEPAEKNNKKISYISPMAKLLINHSIDDTYEGVINGKIKKLKIISIS